MNKQKKAYAMPRLRELEMDRIKVLCAASDPEDPPETIDVDDNDSTWTDFNW